MKNEDQSAYNSGRKTISLLVLLSVLVISSGSGTADMQDRSNHEILKDKKLELLNKLENGSLITSEEIKGSFSHSDGNDPVFNDIVIRHSGTWSIPGEFEFDFPVIPELPDIPDFPEFEIMPFPDEFPSFINRGDFDSLAVIEFGDVNEHLKHDLELLKGRMDSLQSSQEFVRMMEEMKKNNDRFMKEIEDLKEEFRKMQKEIREFEKKRSVEM